MQQQIATYPAVKYPNLCLATGQQEIICPHCLKDAGEVHRMTETPDGYRCQCCEKPQALEMVAAELSGLAAEYYVVYAEMMAMYHELEQYRLARKQTETEWRAIDARR